MSKQAAIRLVDGEMVLVHLNAEPVQYHVMGRLECEIDYFTVVKKVKGIIITLEIPYHRVTNVSFDDLGTVTINATTEERNENL